MEVTVPDIRLGWGLRNLPVKDWRWGWWQLQGAGDIFLPRAIEKTLDTCLFWGSRVGWESQGVPEHVRRGGLNHYHLALLPYIWQIQGTKAQDSGELHFESFLRGTMESYIRIWGHKLYFPCSCFFCLLFLYLQWFYRQLFQIQHPKFSFFPQTERDGEFHSSQFVKMARKMVAKLNR